MSTDDLLARTRAVLPSWLSIYYDDPIEIERSTGAGPTIEVEAFLGARLACRPATVVQCKFHGRSLLPPSRSRTAPPSLILVNGPSDAVRAVPSPTA